MMRAHRAMSCAARFLLLAALVGCAQPLPATHADYAGEWRGKGVVLLITADGRVVYERKADGRSVSLNLPIQRFDGDDFEVGIGPAVTRFDVGAPPANIDGEWRMTVDGRVLTRVDDRATAATDGESIST